MSIFFIDRLSGKKEEENVYGGDALKFVYGDGILGSLIGTPLLHLLVKWPFFSALYGYFQKTKSSKKKVLPFIAKFQVNTSDFLENANSFQSFNDFFIRKLKPDARPIAKGNNVAIIPADGRYYFYQDINKTTGFIVKDEKFNLVTLLDNSDLASKYAHGSMMMARLCPSDYHRYHFPCNCLPGETKLINGWLYSVNPIAIKRDIHIFTENKRGICELQTENFGKILYIEIGATNVGSIHETYQPFVKHEKGAEKGYFSFGASSLILLFEPGTITFDEDLLAATSEGIEIRCLMGQSMGKASQ